MAGNNNQNESTLKYFRSQIPGLSVQIAPVEAGDVAPKTLRFIPYRYISDMGEDLYFGYLATDNARALEIFATDSNVTEISQEDFEKYTDVKSEKITRVGL